MAAFIASSAKIEQCILTGGNANSWAMWVLRIVSAWSKVFPLTHSVTRLLLAIADPQPYVLNLASVIMPDSSTCICNFITSPQAGAPTMPVPTRLTSRANDPTFLGFS